jgi:hypothetical protein
MTAHYYANCLIIKIKMVNDGHNRRKKQKKTAQQATNGTKEFALLLTVYSRKGKKSNEGKFTI